MKFYSCIKRVCLDVAIGHRASAFAIDVVSTINYSDSNQTEKHKIATDHYISKIGEEAAKSVLSQYGTVTGPDYTIYTGKEKSWDDDIVFDRTGVAVKTQKKSAAKLYGLSWTFQSAPARRDIILNNPNAWVIFVEFDDFDPFHCNVFPPFQIKELDFEEPKLDKLKGFKKVVYAASLPLSHHNL